MNIMKLNVRDYFSSSSPKEKDMQESSIEQNPNSKQEKETYRHWGLRMCAIANGSRQTLVPYLHSVYQHIYNEQSRNQEVQDVLYGKLQTQINCKNNEIEHLKQQINASKQQQAEYHNRIAELKEEKDTLKSKAYEVNKEAKIKLILGMTILIPLTLYLFLFYSSTFYSAFFKQWAEDANVMNAMFDANALSNAANASTTVLCFVLFAPVIFMGLGFSLHFFSVQETWTKYIKMMAIITVTFIFDAILAYMIGKHLHEIEVIIGTASLGSTYGVTEALSDINSWAVIFCGFIVYIIWGIVFDMTMTAYNKLDLNKVRTKSIDKSIEDTQNLLKQEKNNESSLEKSVHELNNQIESIVSQISNKVLIDKSAIRTEMVNFFSGWMAQMNVLGLSSDEQQLSNDTFNQTLISFSLN